MEMIWYLVNELGLLWPKYYGLVYGFNRKIWY